MAVASYRSRLTGGWFRHDGQEPDYLQSMTDGFWTTEEPDFNISGDIAGKGLISGQVNQWFYIHENDIDIAGRGLVSAEFFINQPFYVSGVVAGKGEITSDILFNIPIRVSGCVIGKGKPFMRLNYSKMNALNPILKAQNAGYFTEDCPVAAIEYQGFSPNKIINITDQSDDIFENTESFYVVEDIQYSGGADYYPIQHYPYSSLSSGLIDYLVTDTRSDNQNGQPLFYQYELLFDARSASADTLVRNIYKNNETIVDKKLYEVQISNNLISQGNSRYSSATWGAPSGLFGSVVKRARVLLPMDFSDQDAFYTVEYDKVVNGVVSYQKELVELRALYNKEIDYNITESGLVLASGTNISNANSIMIIKDPQFRVAPLEIAALKDQDSFVSYVSDAVSSWNLRLNIGSFLRPSGFYTGDTESFYYLPNTNTSGRLPIANVKPELIGSNVLKVKAAPIYIDTGSGFFSYPDYKIQIYDKIYPYLADPEGKIAIDVNGVTRQDIKVLSIDREKGYLLLDKDLNPTDEIEVSYYIENNSSLVVENLELNPKVNDGTTLFHISGYLDGLGVAMLAYDGTDDTKYPYIYNPNESESSRVAHSLPPIGGISVSVPWNSGDFFTICKLDINRLTKDIVKLTDARRVGGGVDTDLIKDWFKEIYGKSSKLHESEWYTTNGYYDGEPLAYNGAVIIHIPETNISGMRQQWIDHFAKEMDEYNEAIKVGTKEFNYYLDQVIKRYISAGSDYILFPTVSGEVTDILYLE